MPIQVPAATPPTGSVTVVHPVVAVALARTDPLPVLRRAVREARRRDTRLVIVQPVVIDGDLPAPLRAHGVLPSPAQQIRYHCARLRNHLCTLTGDDPRSDPHRDTTLLVGVDPGLPARVARNAQLVIVPRPGRLMPAHRTAQLHQAVTSTGTPMIMEPSLPGQGDPGIGTPRHSLLHSDVTGSIGRREAGAPETSDASCKDLRATARPGIQGTFTVPRRSRRGRETRLTS